MYIDDPLSADVVINMDPVNMAFCCGKKMTIFWIVDDFMYAGMENYYSEHMKKSDLIYITHERYSGYFPEKIRFLPMACDPDELKYGLVKPDFQYIFVGAIELNPLYHNRIRILDSLLKKGEDFYITNGKTTIAEVDHDDYMKRIARGKIFVDVLPKNPRNGLSCLHAKIFEAMLLRCVMVEYDSILDTIFEKDVHYLTTDRFGKIDDETCEKVKKNAQFLLLQKHTWEHRVNKILADIKELRPDIV
jgi:hypothetical protein